MADILNQEHRKSARYGVAAALLAACFFGIGAPVSKILLEGITPLAFAGLLYTGSWIGLFLLTSIHSLATKDVLPRESKLRGGDYLYLAGSILCGGVLAPVLLMYGLLRTSGSVTSLLLNTEGILTTLIAMAVFREHVGRRIWAAAVLMLIASSTLTYMPDGEGWSLRFGSFLVMLSSSMWAVDNNLTKQLSHRDPFVIAKYKGFAAGVINLVIAFIIKEPLPSFGYIAYAVLFGALGYGASLVLFIYALRNLGTSRTITYFGAAPFIGVVTSIIILSEPVTVQLFVAGVLMLIGLRLIMKEYHDHEHTHEAICHEHSHIHDEHHNHEHEDEFKEPHCHPHEHNVLTHSHAHVPDLHHFHKH